MSAAYGAAWDVNSVGVTALLTAPAPCLVVDVAMLRQVVRGTVADALAASDHEPTEDQEFAEVRPELAYEGPEEPLVVEPSQVANELESFDESRETSIFSEQANGGAVAPVLPAVNEDQKRRDFVRNFLAEQRAARGPVIPTR